VGDKSGGKDRGERHVGMGRLRRMMEDRREAWWWGPKMHDFPHSARMFAAKERYGKWKGDRLERG
jgi:hypothetical protein